MYASKDPFRAKLDVSYLFTEMNLFVIDPMFRRLQASVERYYGIFVWGRVCMCTARLCSAIAATSFSLMNAIFLCTE